VGDKEYPTIIQDVTKNPLSDELLHADFYKVRLDEKIKAKIPLNFIGESPAVKNLGGILVKNISEIEVEGFPQDLPHQVNVDISSLKELKGHILVKDLPISEKLKVEADPAAIVVLVQEPISEEELKAQLEAPTAPSAEEVEVIKKEKAEEEAPAAEETTPAGKMEEKAEGKK
jgi:large subunit ribosomal protein L25